MNYTADPLIKVGLRPDYSEAFDEMNNAIAGIATTSSSFWEANNGGIRYQGHIAVGDGQVDSIGASQILTGTLSTTINNQITTTSTSGTVAPVLNELIVNPAVNSSSNYIGQDGIVETLAANSKNYTGIIIGDAGAAYHYGTGLVDNMIGGFFIAEAQGTGNVTNMWAVRTAGIHASSGDITTFYGYQHQQIMTGTNDITNNYGILISGAIVVGGTIGTNYGARIAGQNTGTTDYGLVLGFSDTNTLWVNDGTDSTTVAGGIVFGFSKDTNLYRSAANTLKTDDTFSSAGYSVGATAGVSGSFTTVDGKTVTVTSGIITAIV